MNFKTTNLTDYDDDSWGNAWVEVDIHKPTGSLVVSIVGCPCDDGLTDEAWNTRVHDDAALAGIVRQAKAEADRLDGDFA